jgi:hypothetical protein
MFLTPLLELPELRCALLSQCALQSVLDLLLHLQLPMLLHLHWPLRELLLSLSQLALKFSLVLNFVLQPLLLQQLWLMWLMQQTLYFQ